MAVADVSPRDRHDDETGGEDETQTGGNQSWESTTPIAHMDGHLGRVRAGDEVGGGQEIEKLGVRHPPSTVDDLVPHHGDVGGWTAERGDPQPKEEQDEFAQGLTPRRTLEQRFEWEQTRPVLVAHRVSAGLVCVERHASMLPL